MNIYIYIKHIKRILIAKLRQIKFNIKFSKVLFLFLRLKISVIFRKPLEWHFDHLIREMCTFKIYLIYLFIISDVFLKIFICQKYFESQDSFIRVKIDLTFLLSVIQSYRAIC